MAINGADTAFILISAAQMLRVVQKAGYRIKGDIMVKMLHPTR